jgi:hypothetical protein
VLQLSDDREESYVARPACSHPFDPSRHHLDATRGVCLSQRLGSPQPSLFASSCRAARLHGGSRRVATWARPRDSHDFTVPAGAPI